MGRNQKVEKARRERLKEKGFCPQHKNASPPPGKTHCEKCLLNNRLRAMRAAGVSALETEKAKAAWESFQGKCWCCYTTKPGTKGWVLDHDHETLKFRGILCSSCNLILGHAKDSPHRFKMLVIYLWSDKMANLNEMTNEQREVYRAKVCVAVGLDPDPAVAMLDYIWMPSEAGPQNLVLYARRGTAEILRDINGIDVKSLEQHDGPGYVSFKATGVNKKGRQEISVGAHETEGLKGKRLADAISTAQTRALRRLTMQFAGFGILDESEVSAAIASQVAPAASGAALAGSPMVIPPVPQAAPASAPGRDITPTAADPAAELLPQSPEEFSAAQQTLRDEAKAQLLAKGTEPTTPQGATFEQQPPAKVKRTRKPRNTVNIASPGQQTEMPVGHIDAQGVVSPDGNIPESNRTATPESSRAVTQVSTPALPAPVPQSGEVAVEKAQPVPAQAPVAPPPTAALSPEKATEFKNRLRVYANDVLPRGGMLPSDGLGGITMKLRAFAAKHTGSTDTSALSLTQWEDLFDFLDSYNQKNGAQELVKYIDKALGVAK